MQRIGGVGIISQNLSFTVAELFGANKIHVLSSKELLQGLLMGNNYKILGPITNVCMSVQIQSRQPVQRKELCMV